MLLLRAHLHVAAVDGATEARPQAQAEELTLVVADNSTGYFGAVRLIKPYETRVCGAWRGGEVHVYNLPGKVCNFTSEHNRTRDVVLAEAGAGGEADAARGR